ncbi:MAG: glycosyltransferase [Acidobacteria bacterium]|nr:glycosyltransferase [Acidobacteriota bacterium]
MFTRIALWFFFFPLQLFLLGLFILFDCVRSLQLYCHPLARREVGSQAASRELCSIVILNWNGRHLLEESLPALEKAVGFTGKSHEIIVIDNGSRDDSVSWLQLNHPNVRIVTLNENFGFGVANNHGVEAASHDIVVLLNNDMIVAEDFLPPLLEAFSDPQVFAVSSQVFFPEGKRSEETGNTQAHFKWGYLHLSHEPLQSFHDTRKYLPILWAGGGSSAFHRQGFLQLGGFSSLFSPCYVEDTDLSYRAWRRGWKVLLAAHSKVLHKHRSTSAVRFAKPELKELIEERKFWYIWKNYQLRTVLPHLLFLPLHLIKRFSVWTYLRSLRKLPAALLSRFGEPRRVVSGETLFGWVRHPLTYLNHFHPDRRRTPQFPLRILIVSAYLPHVGRHGGAGRVLQLLQWVSKKHEVSVISFVETEEEAAQRAQLLLTCKRVELLYRRGCFPVSFFPYEPFEEFNTAEFGKKLEEILTEEDFDLVHFEWVQMAQYAGLVPHIPKLITEIEVSYAAHNILVKLESNLFLKLKKLYNAWQIFYRELELCRKVEKVVCVTDKDHDYLRGYIEKKKLSVVNTGVDNEYFSSNGFRPPDKNALVFVGAFRHDPNVDAMLYFCEQIFPLILREHPQTHLYIVGSSPPQSVQELGTHSQVTVTGYVEDIRDYYQRAQIVVVPVRTGVGIRGKILEAWAAGKAIVATSLACSGIRTCHGENLLIADKPHDFALWTLALLRTPSFCERLGRNGRQTAGQLYDWSILGDQMIEEYESLASASYPQYEARNQYP